MMDKLFILFFVSSAVWGNSIDGIQLPVIGSLFPLRIAVLLFGVIVLYKTYISNERVMILQNADTRSNKFRNITVYCATVMVITGLLTVYWAYDNGLVIVNLITWITSFLTVGMCLFYLKSHDDILFASRIYVLNYLVIGGIGFYESFTGDYFNLAYDFYTRQKNFLGLYMPASTMFNINNFAIFMVLSLPICFIATEKLKGKSLFDIGFMGFSGILTILTGCNTALVIMCLIVGIYVFFNRQKGVSKLIIFGVVMILLIFASILGNIFNEILTFSATEDPRMEIWANAIMVAWRYGFMGVGPGNADIVNGIYAQGSLAATTVHNYLLATFEEFGIFGGGFFIFWVFRLIYDSFAIYIKTKHDWLKNVIIFCIIFLPASLCVSTMVGYYFLWAEFGIFIALNEVTEKQIRERIE